MTACRSIDTADERVGACQLRGLAAGASSKQQLQHSSGERCSHQDTQRVSRRVEEPR